MRFAYADPPYLGTSSFGANHHYGEHHANAADYDRVETHAALVARLCEEFDGWALSLSSPSLKTILGVCPNDVRVGAWVKPFASFKPNVNPAYAWEPVIFRGGRKRGKAWQMERGVFCVRDWVSANILLQKGCPGAKPDRFCWWIFDLLGMEADDDFVDVFPGSGAVGRAWEEWTRANRTTPLFDTCGEDAR